MLNYYDGINCFTDASIVTSNGTYIASAGYCIVRDSRILERDYKIIYDATNSYGELYALYLGIMALSRYREYNMPLHVFSDSKISILGSNQWIFNWVSKFNMYPSDKGLTTNTNNTVANQELYLSIINFIYNRNLKVKMYHTLGHINPRYQESLHKARTYFNKVNGERIGDDIAREICYYNNFVDKMTRNNLKDIVLSGVFEKDKYEKDIYPSVYIPDINVMSKYKGLIS